MRNCHSNNSNKWSIEEFIKGIRDNFPQYDNAPDDFIKEKIEPFGEDCCSECHSSRGKWHDRSYRTCKNIQWIDNPKGEGKIALSDYAHDNGWIKFYPNPVSEWAEWHLSKYDNGKKGYCRVCGIDTYDNEDLCKAHEKKLFNRLRKHRRMLEDAQREAALVEIEFFNYEFKKEAISIESNE